MKQYLGLVLIMVVLLFTSCNKNADSEYLLYYLGGQSNMDGYGSISDLPDELGGIFEDVLIFHGNTSRDDQDIDGKGIWTNLRAGHGAGFSSDGTSNTYSERFGCEMTFALKLQEMNPDSKIAILKYSRGGTSIDEAAAGNFGSWDPQYGDGEGINQYDHFLAAVKHAFSIDDIDGDGVTDRLIPSGIIWMQGESDAGVNEEIANRYYENLTELMGLIRNALGNIDIPVVIGRISDSGNSPSGIVWKFGETIIQAQHDFADNDANAAIVISTDAYTYSDPWHYDSEGYIDLGEQFAIAIDSLNNR